MPELPEVETIRRELHKRIRGKRFRAVNVRLPKLVSLGPAVLSPTRTHAPSVARRFEKTLKGRRILSVGRRGKLLMVSLSGDATLLIHLKMAGQIVVTAPGERTRIVRLLNTPAVEPEALPTKHSHIIAELSGRVRLFYNDLRRFGTWRIVRNGDLSKVADLVGLGPDALDGKLTKEDYSARLGCRPNQAVKVALTDQTLLAGIGNIYADEALFRAKLHPLEPVRVLRTGDWEKLFRSVRQVLREAIRDHGSSVGDFVRIDGREGMFGRRHRVYQKTGKPCLRCGTRIVRITVGGRGTHFCPSCQRRRSRRTTPTTGLRRARQRANRSEDRLLPRTVYDRAARLPGESLAALRQGGG